MIDIKTRLSGRADLEERMAEDHADRRHEIAAILREGKDRIEALEAENRSLGHEIHGLWERLDKHKWQPIETVSDYMDGRLVMLWQAGVTRYVSWWVSEPSDHPLEREAPGWAHSVADGKPTHWRPVGPLPSNSEQPNTQGRSGTAREAPSLGVQPAAHSTSSGSEKGGNDAL